MSAEPEVTNMECPNCHRDFKPRRDWQRFCCKRCQQKWNRDQYRAAQVDAELTLKDLTRVNGNAGVTDEHRAKWTAIRAEWDEEDKQEARQPRFLRRFWCAGHIFFSLRASR